jgi:hypothetical protein
MISSNPSRTEPIAFSGAQPNLIRGTMIHAQLRYGLQLRWDSGTLEGRLGGRFIGERLQLHSSGNELLGLIAGGAGNFAVRARLSDTRLELRAVGARGESSATVNLNTESGVLQDQSSSTRFSVLHSHDNLTVMLSDLEGVQLQSDGAPNWVVVAAALFGVIVTREINRAQLESLRDMGEL